MKKLSLIALALCTFTISQAANAEAGYLAKADYIKLCEAVASNSKLKLRRVMQKYHVDFKQLSEGLVCDGMNIMEFAQAKNADDTALFIARRTDLGGDLLITRRIVD